MSFGKPDTRWDQLRSFPTVYRNVHESVYRSYQILEEVKQMLDRHDSIETLQRFIYWAEGEGHDA